MFATTCQIAFVFTIWIISCGGYPYFRGKIPNGYNVPDPCVSGQIWKGVGHFYQEGEGPRNPFGLAFKASSFTWSKVCRNDSDGDGRTNGEELGDPECVWKIGDEPSRNATGHPGICEKMERRKCIRKNKDFVRFNDRCNLTN